MMKLIYFNYKYIAHHKIPYNSNWVKIVQARSLTWNLWQYAAMLWLTYSTKFTSCQPEMFRSVNFVEHWCVKLTVPGSTPGLGIFHSVGIIWNSLVRFHQFDRDKIISSLHIYANGILRPKDLSVELHATANWMLLSTGFFEYIMLFRVFWDGSVGKVFCMKQKVLRLTPG